MPLGSNKASCQPGLQDIECKCWPNDASAQAKDIDVVMLNALMRGIGVVTKRRPNSTQLVGCHTGADTAATDQDAPLDPSFLHGFSDRFGVVREIDRVRAMGSQIKDFVSLFLEKTNNLNFKRVAGMIGSHRNKHKSLRIPHFTAAGTWRQPQNSPAGAWGGLNKGLLPVPTSL